MSLYVVAPRSRRIQAAHDRSLRIVDGDVSLIRSGKVPAGADGAIVSLEGERFLSGSRSLIRHRLRTPGLRGMALLHYPAIPQVGVDLIVVQPRWFSSAIQANSASRFASGVPKEEIEFGVRIAASTEPNRPLFFALRDCKQPWAQLSLAALEAQENPSVAADRLRRLWQREDSSPIFRSLVLRNLIVLTMQQGDLDKARVLLDPGMEAFPEYADLRWLSGVEWLMRKKFTAAKHDAERAIARAGSPHWIGSGGENSYRAQWLVGTCHAYVGSQEGAVNHFINGWAASPPFAPSVEAMLDLRLPTPVVERLTLPFCRAVRHQPAYLNAVFDYFLLHRCFESARHLADSVALDDATRLSLRERLDKVAAPFQPLQAVESGIPGIVLQTAFWETSSMALIGRILAQGLLDQPDCDVALEPQRFGTCAPQELLGGEELARAMLHHPRRLDLTIRMSWPPDFRRPPRGRLACVFPWEYQGVPLHWIRQMRQNVDEVWVPSRWVAGVLERAGLERQRIRVIPNGIAPDVFTPNGPTAVSKDARGFVFLFVGGAIARKGFDLLLDAYEEAFSSRDDVTLWIKEFGSTSFYAHNSMLAMTNRFAPGSRAPHMLINTDTMDELKLAALYRRADCLVHPYRGEGFGLPLAEAMACGTPVITTAEGPAAEFCSEETGWLIPATTALVPDDPPPVGELSEPLKWYEPRFDELVRAMRAAYENRQGDTKRRGAEAARRIHATHTWPQIVEQYAGAVREMVGEPVREVVLA